MGPLEHALLQRRPALATAAQGILDDWHQDADGFDEVLGAGGACDAISGAFEDVLHFQYIDAAGQLRTPDFMDGGQDGDDHAWLVVYDDYEAVVLDLPAHVYEISGGYSWRKRQGVRVRTTDIVLEAMPRRDIYPDDAD